MSDERRHRHSSLPGPRSAAAARLFGRSVAASAMAYDRVRDLPRLLALWPHEIDDWTDAGRLNLLARLRRALRAERRRARTGHWSYDLNRHLGLLSAYKGELANLGRTVAGTSPTARPAPEPKEGHGGNSGTA